MASLTTDHDGCQRIQFEGRDGKRKAIRLGKIPKSKAETFRNHVSHLVSAIRFKDSVDDRTRLWLDGLADDVHAKLSGADLIPVRESLLLGAWATKYIAGRKAEKMKPSSLRKLEQSKGQLLTFFGDGKPLRNITADEASDWRTRMLKKLSDATVKIHCGNIKSMFKNAVTRKLVPENPFNHLPSGATARRDSRILLHCELQEILSICPDAEWKLWFGLPFYATTRVPSETQDLTWSDMDWEKGRLFLRSPKTERHKGHESRIVPVVPELFKILQSQFDAAPPGCKKILRLRKTGHVVDKMNELILAAGVKPWTDLFQTLRASGESWHQANGMAAHHAAMMAGHSVETSRRHYVKCIPDEVLTVVAARPPKMAQNPAQQGKEIGGIPENTDNSEGNESGTSLQGTATCGISTKSGEMGDEGFEPPTSSV
jgi:integrase